MSRRQPVSLPSRMQREVRKVEAEAREANHGRCRHRPNDPEVATPPAAPADAAGSAKDRGRRTAGRRANRTGGLLCGNGRHSTRRPARARQTTDARTTAHGRAPSPWRCAITRNGRTIGPPNGSGTAYPMLEVIWSAVIDERPIASSPQDIGYGRTRTARAIICGLRHYAAWCRSGHRHPAPGMDRRSTTCIRSTGCQPPAVDIPNS